MVTSKMQQSATAVDEEIDAVYIHKRDFLRLVSGESIPADGILALGFVGVDESMMTGYNNNTPIMPPLLIYQPYVHLLPTYL